MTTHYRQDHNHPNWTGLTARELGLVPQDDEPPVVVQILIGILIACAFASALLLILGDALWM